MHIKNGNLKQDVASSGPPHITLIVNAGALDPWPMQKGGWSARIFAFKLSIFPEPRPLSVTLRDNP